MEKYKVEIKWGIIFSLSLLAWTGLEKIVGLHDTHIDKHPIYTNVFILVAFLLYYFALREKKASLGGVMSWKEGFIAGIIIGFVVALLTPLSQYIVHTFISPDYFKNAIAYGLKTQDLMTEDQLKEYFNLTSYIKQSTLGAPILGAFTAAIISLLVKSPRSENP